MLATAVVYFITAFIGENVERGSHEAKAVESGQLNLEGSSQHEAEENSHVTAGDAEYTPNNETVFAIRGSHEAMETNQGNMTMIEQQQQQQQQKEAKDKSNSLQENGIGIDESNESVKRSIEFPLFLTAGIGYGLVGFWMLRDPKNSRVPYIITASGSILLIGLYTASHTVGLPQIGLEHVGVLDLLVAALQVAIVGCSGYVILSISEKRITKCGKKFVT